MKKKFVVGLILTLSLSLSNLSPVFASTITPYNNIPQSVVDEANKKVEDSKFEIPEIQAWETINGVEKEIEPISELEKKGVSSLAVPNDGYVYRFSHYNPTANSTNWNYSVAGICRFENQLSSAQGFLYEQENDKIVEWNVGGNISADLSAGNSFLAKVKASVGFNVDRSQTWAAKTKYGSSITVPGKTVAYVTNYQVGTNSSGRLYWNKYSPSGTSLIGTYSEAAGGTAVNKDLKNIVLSNTSPIN